MYTGLCIIHKKTSAAVVGYHCSSGIAEKVGEVGEVGESGESGDVGDPILEVLDRWMRCTKLPSCILREPRSITSL